MLELKFAIYHRDLISDSMAGEGSRPLPIQSGRRSVGSLGGISSGSAASRRTLVA